MTCRNVACLMARYDHAMGHFRNAPPAYAYGVRVAHKFLAADWITNFCEGRVRALPYRATALAHSKFHTFRRAHAGELFSGGTCF